MEVSGGESGEQPAALSACMLLLEVDHVPPSLRTKGSCERRGASRGLRAPRRAGADPSFSGRGAPGQVSAGGVAVGRRGAPG